ncbi:hypothetical protein DFQ28_010007 [Apophysomyces sp. BC1034]|nr:hypothetical protein DFQ28_010007 [Apophysomyces sp. BC1034]
MPATEQGIRVCAAREGWEARRRVKGKGMEYAFASLLASVQDEIRRRAASALVSKVSTDRLLPARREQQLGLVETNAQRLKADARKGLLTALERLMAQCHISPVDILQHGFVQRQVRHKPLKLRVLLFKLLQPA